MKSIIYLLLLAGSAFACDITKGVYNPVDVLLDPGVTHSEYWDYSDCTVGITSDSFYIAVRDKQGVLKCPGGSINIDAHLYDLTTGVEYIGGNNHGCLVWIGINNYASVCGHVLRLDLTLQSSKSVDAAIIRSVNMGGPCQ